MASAVAATAVGRSFEHKGCSRALEHHHKRSSEAALEWVHMGAPCPSAASLDSRHTRAVRLAPSNQQVLGWPLCKPRVIVKLQLAILTRCLAAVKWTCCRPCWRVSDQHRLSAVSASECRRRRASSSCHLRQLQVIGARQKRGGMAAAHRKMFVRSSCQQQRLERQC